MVDTTINPWGVAVAGEIQDWSVCMKNASDFRLSLIRLRKKDSVTRISLAEAREIHGKRNKMNTTITPWGSYNNRRVLGRTILFCGYGSGIGQSLISWTV